MKTGSVKVWNINTRVKRYLITCLLIEAQSIYNQEESIQEFE